MDSKTKPAPEGEVVIRLTIPEAVVLDALLRRFSTTDQLQIEDRAEQHTLWNLQCVFETVNKEDWIPLDDARAALR